MVFPRPVAQARSGRLPPPAMKASRAVRPAIWYGRNGTGIFTIVAIVTTCHLLRRREACQAPLPGLLRECGGCSPQEKPSHSPGEILALHSELLQQRPFGLRERGRDDYPCGLVHFPILPR